MKPYARYLKLLRKRRSIERKLAREQKRLNRAIWEVFGL